MASTFSDLGIELMATGENAGTWGDKTNTNLQIVEKAIAGYVEKSVAGGAQTTALTITDGDTTESTSVARHAVIKLTGTITGNQIVTVPDSIEKVYIVVNGTTGAHTVQFKTASGTGITFGASDKGTRLVFSDGTNIVDAGGSVGAHDLNGEVLTLDADADTTITADTDDQIDIAIAGADDFRFTANTFTALSGSSVVIPDGGLTLGSTAVTSTAAELNILDGVTSTAAELNILDGVTSTAAELNILDGVTSTAAELNILDGVTSTATELNIIDGDTSATSTTVADADRVVLNDNGTMVQVAVTDLAAYFDDEITAMPNLTSVGTLTTLTVDNIIINGTNIGHTSDTDALAIDSSGNVTASQNLVVTGDLTVNGTTTTVNSTTVTIDDPIFTLGGDSAPGSDDNKDRGIEFRYHNGSAAKVGFFGFDDSTSKFTFIADASNSSEVFSGSAGDVAFGEVAATSLSINSTAVTSTATELNLLDGKDATHLAVPGKLEGANFTDSLLIGHATTGTLDAAQDNTGVGIAALDAITSGDNNTAVGSDAGTSLTTAGNNTLIGFGAGDGITGAPDNTAIGSGALSGTMADTNSGYNVAVGANSLNVLNGGAFNVAIGRDSGRAVSSGDYNILIGYDGGDNITTGSGNVIIGTIDADSATGDRQLKIAGNDGSTTTTWISGDNSGNLTFAANATVTGDLTVSGDDITMGTNTAGNLLIADGTNFNSVAATSLSEISTVANDDVFIAVDTSGGGLKKITRSAIVAGLATSGAISNLSEDSTPQLGGNLDVNGNDIVTTSNADIELAPDGTGKVVIKGNTNQGKIVLNCEANSHGQTIIAAPHSESADNVLTLPSTGGDARLVSTSSTATLTNKTLTTPVITEIDSGSTITLDATTDIVLDADGGDVFFKDGGTTIATLTNSSSDFVITTGVQDKDFIIKGDDGGSAITALTIDMSDAGTASFNHDIKLGDNSKAFFGDSSDLQIYHDSSNSVIEDAGTGLLILGSSNGAGVNINKIGGGENLAKFINDGAVELYHDNSKKFETASGGVTVTGEVAATSLDISGDVDVDGTLETDALSIASTTVTSTAAELNILDGVTSTTAELNILDGVTSTAAELNILDGVTATTAEINLIDGGTARGTTAVADGDGILHNDNGTMRMTSAATFKTYFQSGLSTSSAADDITAGDAAVNITTSSGNITIDAAANDTDIIFKGTDNSSDITMLTLDGSDAGTAIFNHDIKVGDAGKFIAGAEGDLEIHHDGSNSHIEELGTGNLFVNTNGAKVAIISNSDTSGGKMAEFNADSSVELHFDGSQKFATSSGGVDITGAITATATSTITTSDNTAQLILKSTDADANTGPTLQLVRDSGSPADNDLIGSIDFVADDDGGNSFTAFNMFAKATDVSNGSEDAEMQLRVMVAGTLTDRLKFNADGTTFTGNVNVGNTIAAGSTNLTLDVSGDISLDADGGDIFLKDGGTTFGEFTNSSTNLVIKSTVSDQDIIFNGNDGGSGITALTLDMSDAGTAIFNHDIKLADNSRVLLGGGNDLEIRHSGSDSFIQDSGTGDLIFKSNGTDVKIIGDNDEDIAKFTWNDGVELYYNNSKKFEVESTGIVVTGSVLPAADDTHDLGSSSKQWRDIYTGDINLNNTKTRDNEVDGTRGSWTIQEGSDDLFLLNRLNGKKYKFKLEEM